MSFPWTTLITAGFTLAGAVGGVSLSALLTARADQRRFAHEHSANRNVLRADAYADFLKLSHADVRALAVFMRRIEQGEPSSDTIADLRVLIVEFHAALARVEIVGTDSAVEAARNVASCARALGGRCAKAHFLEEPYSEEAANVEYEELTKAVEGFADYCRRELAS
ncbi:hypothetical protein [Actinomadura kijaniata]|uniref:hypothetical protein n=1 Tax=Actinomadura kijaniata TaxID=46161 RepID=UPI0012F7F18E|nr:hypothetical protein [Actinomadura kijaniata]